MHGIQKRSVPPVRPHVNRKVHNWKICVHQTRLTPPLLWLKINKWATLLLQLGWKWNMGFERNSKHLLKGDCRRRLARLQITWVRFGLLLHSKIHWAYFLICWLSGWRHTKSGCIRTYTVLLYLRWLFLAKKELVALLDGVLYPPAKNKQPIPLSTLFSIDRASFHRKQFHFVHSYLHWKIVM